MRRTTLSRLIRLVALPASLGIAACATNSSSTGLPGVFGGVDFTAISGPWEGTYEGPVESGRVFLKINGVSRDEATAQFALQPKGALAPRGQNNVPVGRSGSNITLRLDNWEDPLCRCTVSSVFTGAVQGDQITGTFTTTGDAKASQRGTWRAQRSTASQ